ncbi:AI-2E family transporter [Niveispirillum sp. KHB5.9]|uniref:AI-2E family transporter n=1 Tax=Niveispirillum sp. KHB5.9 TaxID=3400269 RepID=UPI003A8A5E76
MDQDTARLQARNLAMLNPAPPGSKPAALLVFALIVAALYLAADILIPIALAVLLTFVLSPIVSRLERWRLGRIPSVLMVVAMVFAGIVGFGAVVGSQLGDLADNLPTYQRNIQAKIHSLRSTAESASGGSAFQQAAKAFHGLSRELEEATQTDDPSGSTSAVRSAERAPIPVRIDQPPGSGALEVMRAIVGPALAPFAMAGLVLVLAIFMLLQREDLRDRLIYLVGAGDLSRTTEAMNDAGERVSRYLLMQMVVNVTYGFPIGIGLWLIGVPNPLLWGLLGAVLRFIPFLGPVIAASFPILLSFAVDAGWTLPLLCIALFIVIELFSNNVVEPWLYGATTGLSSLAIIVSAIVWTSLWGPVGLLLATPLTVCLVVLGRHVPQFRFLEVMLGDRIVLPAEAKIYQRLLARDPTEAAEIAETHLGQSSPVMMADGLLLPALLLAEQDRRRGTLPADARTSVAAGMEAVLDELSDPAGIPTEAPVILCIGSRNNLDGAAAAVLAYLLNLSGRQTDIITSEKVSPRSVASHGTAGVASIMLSSLNPGSLPHVRRVVHRLRLHFGPTVPIIVCLWGAMPAVRTVDEAGAEAGIDHVVTNAGEAMARLKERGLL